MITLLFSCDKHTIFLTKSSGFLNKQEKILVVFNLLLQLIGLMISAYAKASSSLNVEEYKQRAIKAAEFLKTHACDANTNTLLRSCYVDGNGDIVNM